MLAKLTLLALVSAALAVPRQASVKPRADIDVDAVVGFAETVPDTAAGELMLKWQPYLYVVDGCVPFPAVDEDGNTR
jgi:hypothetical protein